MGQPHGQPNNPNLQKVPECCSLCTCSPCSWWARVSPPPYLVLAPFILPADHRQPARAASTATWSPAVATELRCTPGVAAAAWATLLSGHRRACAGSASLVTAGACASSATRGPAAATALSTTVGRARATPTRLAATPTRLAPTAPLSLPQPHPPLQAQRRPARPQPWARRHGRLQGQHQHDLQPVQPPRYSPLRAPSPPRRH